MQTTHNSKPINKKPIKMKAKNIFQERQQELLKEIMLTAMKFTKPANYLTLEQIIDDAVIRLQRAYPTTIPHILLEAVCYAIEQNPRFSEEDKEFANTERESWRFKREQIYEDVRLKFNL